MSSDLSVCCFAPRRWREKRAVSVCRQLDWRAMWDQSMQIKPLLLGREMQSFKRLTQLHMWRVSDPRKPDRPGTRRQWAHLHTYVRSYFASLCSDLLLSDASFVNSCDFHFSFLPFIAINPCGNSSYNVSCQFREYCRVNFAKPEYYECGCPPNFKLNADSLTCTNSFCELNPDACGDNTTLCTNTNATDPNQILHTCGCVAMLKLCGRGEKTDVMSLMSSVRLYLRVCI